MIPEELKKNYFKAISLKSFKGLAFDGSSPKSIFVSSGNYPSLQVGIVSLPELAGNSLLYDLPEEWLYFTSEEILFLRKQLINSMKSFSAFQAADPGRELTQLQEIAASRKQSDLDINLKKEISVKEGSETIHEPLMNYALMEKFDFISNPSIPMKVDKIISDTDLKSADGVKSLYSMGFPVSSIYKILSVGLLGTEKSRKLVPTKWSITASDDIISKILIEKIKDYPPANDFSLFESHYFDNHFYVLLIPSLFAFEMLESWNAAKQDFNSIAVDFETGKGRKGYASNITGAYYSARLAVAEHLDSARRQASVVVIREIGSGYKTPLGVWQIRENVRNAVNNPPKKFNDLKSLISHLNQRLSIPFKYYEKKSSLLGNFLHQKTLADWF